MSAASPHLPAERARSACWGRVLRGLRFCAVAGGLVAALAARAEDSVPADGTLQQWLPSLSLGFDVQIEPDVQGTVSSTINTTATGSQDFITAVPDLQAELMTPVLAEWPGSPRLFALAEWDWGWLFINEDRPVVKDGSIGGPVLIPPRCQPGNSQACDEDDLDLVEGMGSRLDAGIQNGWSAGLGVGFSVPLGEGSKLLLKPSFLYHGELVDLRGQVKAPFLIPGMTVNDNIASYHEIAGSQDEVFHSLGTRLSVEYEAARRGPLGILLYAQGQAFWWLDPKASFTETNTAGSAQFDFRRNDVVVGAGLGIRLQWQGR